VPCNDGLAAPKMSNPFKPTGCIRSGLCLIVDRYSHHIHTAQPIRREAWPHRLVSLTSRVFARPADSSNERDLIQGQLDIPLNRLSKSRQLR
jgi:hypothetical protein